MDRSSFNKLKPKEFFRIKIEGINTYLYKVEINNEDVDTTDSLPKNIFSLLDVSGLNTVVANLNSITDIVKSIPKKDTLGMMGFENKDGKPLERNELKRQIEEHQKRVSDFFEDLVKEQDSINELYIRAQDEQNKFLLVKPRDTSTIHYKNILDDFKKLKSNMGTLNLEVVKKKGLLEGLLAANSYALKQDENADLNALSTQLVTLYTKLETSITAVNLELSAEKYSALSSELIALENNKGYEYVSFPIQRYEDVNKLEITITPRDEKSRLNSYKTTLRIPDYEKSFWGVSTGFYITQNQEQNYSLVEKKLDDDSTVYDFISEDHSKEEVGINSMIRYGFNIGVNNYGNLFWQFGLGAGLTINEKIKPRLFVGTGLAYGKKNKLILDFGGVYMFYDKLSNAYQLEGNEAQPTNFMVTATQMRGYVSLGYTIKL